MVPSPQPTIVTHFAQVSDPRTGNAKLHELLDILVIALCAVICGADDWEAMSRWGQTQRRWLKRFLALPHGIPSPDTFRWVFERLNPDEFRQAFRAWVQSVNVLTAGQAIAIDGKTLPFAGPRPGKSGYSHGERLGHRQSSRTGSGEDGRAFE